MIEIPQTWYPISIRYAPNLELFSQQGFQEKE